MGIKLVLDNKYVRIKNAPRSILRQIEAITSYLVAGHYFSPAFKNRRWDGKEHLMKFSDKYGYRAPSGLFVNISKQLKRNRVKFTVIDKRRKPKDKIEFEWNDDIVLRDYQLACVDAALSSPMPGNGLLVMPIRSGKTITAGAIIKRLGVKTVFCVTSQLLLYQTKKSFEELFQEPIGMIGDSVWDEGRIIVATVQSLDRARGGTYEKEKKKVIVPPDPRYTRLVSETDCVFFDESHHLKGKSWHEVMQDFDSFYKMGLSATIFLDNEKECEKGVIWLQGCCGNVRYRISPSKLIRDGWLMRPKIRLYKVTEPDDLRDHRWSKSLQNDAIYENETRNELICKLAIEQIDNNKKVLIVTNRINQIEILVQELSDRGVPFAAITGSVPGRKRQELIEDYVEGHYKILLGTVFGEGVDLPSVEVVINAEGGRDVKSTIQKMRNLTPKKGKKEAIYIDFIDMTNPYFANHSLERLRVYRSEKAFNVEVCEEENS